MLIFNKNIMKYVFLEGLFFYAFSCLFNNCLFKSKSQKQNFKNDMKSWLIKSFFKISPQKKFLH